MSSIISKFRNLVSKPDQKRAASYFVARQYSEAGEEFERVTDIDPDNKEAYNLGCMAFVCAKRYSDAERICDRAINRWPKDPKWNVQKGISFMNQNLFEKAISEYDEALNKEPKHYAAYYHKGRELEKMSRYAEAKTCYQEYVKLAKYDNDEDFKYVQERLEHLTQKGF